MERTWKEGGRTDLLKGSTSRRVSSGCRCRPLICRPAHKSLPYGSWLMHDWYWPGSTCSGAPEAGINALGFDSVFNSINTSQQILTQDNQYSRYYHQRRSGCQCHSEYASGRFYLRAWAQTPWRSVYQKVENIVKGAALAADRLQVWSLQNWVDDVVPAPLFDQLFFKSPTMALTSRNRKKQA